MKVRWEDLDLTAWDAAHAAAAASLQQDSAYGVAMQKMGVPVLRAQVEVDGVRVAYAQFIVRRFGKLGAVALCTRGPIWLTPLTPKEESAVYAELKKTIPLQGLRFVLFTPEIPQGQPHGLHPWRRVMTGMSTVMIDLTPSMEELRAQLDRRWRHRLVGGEASEMTIHRVGTNPGQFRWVLEAEMQQRSDKGLEGLPLDFFEHYVASRPNPAKTILTLRADMGRDRIAAMMFLIHGEAAIYHVGWTTEQGRDYHAHNLILWKAMEELKSRGIRRLDLGGVNTIRSAGIARFKMSTGGDVLTLAGTYF
jgi:lipid II:glycine glycyltransferase (peptidoglycan interpeptide bridge formation enzyme)